MYKCHRCGVGGFTLHRLRVHQGIGKCSNYLVKVLADGEGTAASSPPVEEGGEQLDCAPHGPGELVLAAGAEEDHHDQLPQEESTEEQLLESLVSSLRELGGSASAMPRPDMELEVAAFLVSLGPISKGRQFFDILARHKFAPLTFARIFSMTDAVTAAREYLTGPGFKHVDLGPTLGHPDHEPHLVSYREGLASYIVKDLLFRVHSHLLPEERHHPKTGQRMYNEFFTGMRMRTQQLILAAHHNLPEEERDALPVIAVLLWSDGTRLDQSGRHGCRTALLGLGNHSIEDLSKEGGLMRVLYQPELRRRPDESKPAYKARRRLAQIKGIEFVLDQIRDAAKRLHVCVNPAPRPGELAVFKAALTLGVYSADLKETWDLLCISPFPSAFPSHRYLVGVGDLGKPTLPAPARTEQGMIGALDGAERLRQHADECAAKAAEISSAIGRSKAKAVMEAAGVASRLRDRARELRAQADELLHSQSLTGMRSPVLGIVGAGGPGCFPVDILHQDHGGLGKHLADAVEQDTKGQPGGEGVWGAICARLAGLRRRHPGAYNIPSRAFDTDSLKSEERRTMMLWLPAAANGLVSDDVVDVLFQYAVATQVRDFKVHTESTLQLLEALVSRLSQRIPEVFPNYNWAFPKFYHMRLWAEDIRNFGMLEIGSTARPEAGNAFVHDEWDCTNKQPKALSKQLAEASLNAAAAKAVSRAAVPSKPQGGMGARLAEAGWAKSLVSKTAVCKLPLDCLQAADVSSLPEHLREVRGLEALGQLLREEAEALGCAWEGPALIRSKAGIPRPDGTFQIVHSDYRFNGRNNSQAPDFVEVLASGDVWYGQVVAVLSLRTASTTTGVATGAPGSGSNGAGEMLHFLLLRWLESPDETDEFVTAEECRGSLRQVSDAWGTLGVGVLDLRQLQWQQQWRVVWRAVAGKRAKKKVRELVSPCTFGLVHLAAVLRQVAVVPNWKLDPTETKGKFLLNDLPDWEFVFGVD